MALFPAFGSVSEDKNDISKTINSDLEWLYNGSYSNVDAVNLHQRNVHTHTQDTQHTHSDKLQPGDGGDDEDGDDEDGDDVRVKKRKRKEKRKRKKEKKSSQKKTESNDDTIYPRDLLTSAQRSESCVNVGGVLWLDDLQADNERLFYMDRKSDPQNWEYRSLYRAHLARYRRKGSSVLGLDSRTQVVFWEDSAPGRGRKQKVVGERYFSSSNRQALRSEALPIILRTPPTDSESIPDINSALFIPLPPCTEEIDSAPHADARSDSLGVYDRATSLWMEGKGPIETKGEGQGSGSSGFMKQVEEFNRKLREDPTDDQLWLQFIRFQDEVSPSLVVQGTERALWERKLSIAERALQGNPGSVDLQLERLRLGGELWDGATLLKEWKKLVFIHPNSAPLWKKYIMYAQSRFSSFSVSSVTGIYRKCLSTLSAVQDGSMTSHPALPGTEQDLLDVCVSQCYFLKQAGQMEKAVSLFQALIEFNFFKPDNVKNLLTSQQVAFFEPFWDSGEPRVGEGGARGWKSWMKQQERGGWIHTPDPEEEEDDDEDEAEIKDKSQPRWRIWLDVESWREANHWLPWRPDKSKGQSEEDCEDPDRQVLFDDIGHSLIRLETPELRLRLLLAFLHFMGAPVSPSLSTSCVLNGSSLLDDPALVEEPPDSERPLTSHDLPLSGICAVGHMTLLSGWGRKWVGLCKQGEELLRNVLEQTLPLFSGEHRAVLTLSWIRYEKLKVVHTLRAGNKKRARLQGRGSKRVLKRLLKREENRGSLILWREFGHVEWLLGNIDEARRVFDSALALGGAAGLTDSALCGLCLLYAQLEVELACKGGAVSSETTPSSSRAVYVLTKLAEGATYRPFTGEISAVAVLKARKAYERAVSEGGTGQNRCALIGCFGLFQYLTVGIDAADCVFTQNMEHASDREAVCIQRVALLLHHANVHFLPLRRLRAALNDTLILLPHSAPLWRLRLQADTRYCSAAHTRRFLHAIGRGSRSIVPRLFILMTEQQRKKRIDAALRFGLPADSLPVFPETGLSNRIRSLFEAAVATEHGAHCPLLWRMYMHFMVSNGDAERGTGVFYKALQNVPWNKMLYVEAVQLFPDRLQEILDLLMEKELRLRTPMEELDILLED